MRHVVAAMGAVLTTLVTVALLPIETASALPPDSCPGGFYLLAVFPGAEFADANGDGWICGKDLPQNPFGGLILDNIVKG